MKYVEIKCSVCDTRIAEIRKQNVTPRDMAEYRVCFTCDCGGQGEPTNPVDEQ